MLSFDEAKHEYRWNGEIVPGVSEILSPIKPQIPGAIARPAMAFGKMIHVICQYYDEGDLDESCLDDVGAGYLQGWCRFMADHHAKWDAIEERRYSTHYRYAGTIDRRGWVDSRQAIVDIKTGREIYRPYEIQMAGYWGLLDDPCHERMIVHLKGDGQYDLVALDYDERDWDVFRALIEIYRWRENGKRTRKAK